MDKHILLFAGQGSIHSVDKTHLLSTSAIATNFLEQCHKALVAELEAVPPTEKSSVEGIIDLFPSPSSLIDPTTQDHPVVQGISLYIHQILEFILYTEDSDFDGEGVILESAGFCSGILPAVIISLCPFPTSKDFQHLATIGFKVAFWIGLRVAIFCNTFSEKNAKDHPWSLTIQGLGVSELEALVTGFNASARPRLPLRVAAILSEKVVSVAGEGYSLHQLASENLPAKCTYRFANIHGYYHGGELMANTLNEIVGCVQDRGIFFPSWESLRFPVRSTVTGRYLSPQSSSSTLLATILGNVLVHRVDWNTTAQKLVHDTLERLDSDRRSCYTILAIGPNSNSLLRAINNCSKHSRLRVANFEPVRINGPSRNDIAIVGMSVNYPSGKSMEMLWETLEKSLNVVQEVPSSRFTVSDYYDKNSDKSTSRRKLSSKYGNFLENPFAFDNQFFQISPREAKSMDPQQRLLLHAALEAMEDAGYAPDSTASFQRETMGVYVGAATLDYVDNTRNDIDVYYSPGTLRAFLSGRISYAFQLKGPSVVIDTACSSSTIALYQACRALQAGDCTSALAGGVNVISSPDMYLGLSRAHFLSPTGQCKPWDASADGYCRAEGCGLFVLKKLSDAVAEKDRIYGVIRGVEVNQCGTAKSITHPDATTQAQLFKTLLSKTKVDPNSIGVVEAHGTGTQAGDFAEVNSLQAAFGTARSPDNPLLLSSIKGNIGHAEAASGAAGLAKLLLMLKHKQVPPQAAYQKLNPRLASMNEHNMLVPTEIMEWKTPTGQPRRALLNNFGAAGSNGAVLLEEYTHSIPNISQSVPRSCHVLNISAKTQDALEKLREGYCTYLERVKSSDMLSNLCYSANARKQEFDAFRISISGSSSQDMLRKLQQTKVVPKPAKITNGNIIAFVFSGQGSIHAGMGAELLLTAPVFRDNVKICNAMLKDMGFPEIMAFISGDSKHLDALDYQDHIVVSQCACFVLEYCLAQLWISCGVCPDVMTGHSLGEYAALATAGVLSLNDALFLVAKRAELMARLCPTNSTGMAACNVAPDEAEKLILEFGGLSVACKNGSSDSVVAGPLTSLQRFVESLKASGHKAKVLDVPFAFHSDAMDPILEPFARIVANITLNPPKIAMVSSYLARLTVKDDFCVENFVGHARQPVEFIRATEVISQFAGNKELTFIEVGPAPITLPLIKATLKESDAIFLPSLKPKEESWVSMSSSLSSLFLRRTPIRWRQVYDGLDARFLTDTPRYPLAPATFVVPFVEPNTSSHGEEPMVTSPSRRFLDGSQSANEMGPVFRSKKSALEEFIKAHIVGGTPLCPASVYIELALEALDAIKPEQGQYHTLSDLTFDNPLVYTEDSKDMCIQTMISAKDSSFKVMSAGSILHSAGSVPSSADDRIAEDFARRTSYIKRQMDSVGFLDQFSTRMLYEVIFPRVVTYSAPYITIKQMSIAASGLEGFGTFKIPETDQSGFICPPAFTDTLLHAAGFIANSKINSDEACICVKVERVTVPASITTTTGSIYSRELGVYCSLLECSGDYIIGDAYALDVDGQVLACIEGMHFKRLRLASFKAHLSRVFPDPSKAYPTPRAAIAPMKNTINHGRTVQKSQQSIPNSIANRTASATVPVQKIIKPILYQTISEVCGISEADIRGSTRLSDIGVDSLLSIELTTTLQHRLTGMKLSEADFAHCETLHEMEEVLKNLGARLEDGLPSADQVPDLSNGQSTPTSEVSIDSSSLVRMDEFLEEVCGFSLQGIDKNTTLASLGVDSLLSIELVSGLNHTFGIQLDDATLPEMSIHALEDVVFPKEPELELPLPNSKPSRDDYSINLSAETSVISEMDTSPSCLQKSDQNSKLQAPLYLFHDGSGLCKVYARLGDLGRDVYGVPSIDFSQVDESIITLEELASRYIHQLGLTDKGDIILGGWSFGGVLAFEVSRQLRHHRNTSVKGVILIDSPQPISHEPLPHAVVSHICERMSAHTPAMQQIRRAIKAQFHRNARLLGAYNPTLSQGNNADKDVQCIMLKCKGTFDAEGLCNVKYGWLSDEQSRMASIKAWEGLVGSPVPVLDVDGNHFDLFSPEHVEKLSTQVKKASLMLQSQS